MHRNLYTRTSLGFNLPVTTISLVQGDASAAVSRSPWREHPRRGEMRQDGVPEVLFNLPRDGGRTTCSPGESACSAGADAPEGKLYRAEELYAEGSSTSWRRTARGERGIRVHRRNEIGETRAKVSTGATPAVPFRYEDYSTSRISGSTRPCRRSTGNPADGAAGPVPGKNSRGVIDIAGSSRVTNRGISRHQEYSSSRRPGSRSSSSHFRGKLPRFVSSSRRRFRENRSQASIRRARRHCPSSHSTHAQSRPFEITIRHGPLEPRTFSFDPLRRSTPGGPRSRCFAEGPTTLADTVGRARRYLQILGHRAPSLPPLGALPGAPPHGAAAGNQRFERSNSFRVHDGAGEACVHPAASHSAAPPASRPP